MMENDLYFVRSVRDRTRGSRYLKEFLIRSARIIVGEMKGYGKLRLESQLVRLFALSLAVPSSYLYAFRRPKLISFADKSATGRVCR